MKKSKIVQSMNPGKMSLNEVKLSLSRGNADLAKNQIDEFLYQNPNDLDGLYLLGAIFIKSGNPIKAIPPLVKVVKEFPDNPTILNTLGCAYFAAKDLKSSEEILKKAVQIAPDYMEAVGNYGMLLQQIGRLDEAMKHLSKAVHSPEAAQNVVEAWFREMLFQGRSHETIPYLPQMLEKYPNSMYLNCTNASYLEDQGKFELAERAWKKAEAINFRNPDVEIMRGSRQIIAGDIKGARKHLDKALHRDPLNANALFVWVSAFSRYESDHKILRVIQSQVLKALERKELTFRDYSQLQFAAGAIADTLGDKDIAFKHYCEGNTVVWDRYSITKDVYIQTGRNIKSSFDAAFFEKNCDVIQREPMGEDYLGEGLIFIGCMPRSGTTLTEQILSRGERIKAGGERDEIERMVTASMRDDYSNNANLANLTIDRAREIASIHHSFVKTQVEGGQMFSDKTPRSFYHFGLLYTLFPKAKFINCLRNPMDTCLSCYFNYFQWNSVKFSYDLETLGVYYSVYEELMHHWREVLPIEIHDVVYEKLTANPEQEIRKLISFCGLSWDDAYLSIGKGNRVVKTASASQVRQPMYRSSVERWKPYEKYLFPLLNALKDDYTLSEQ